MKKFFLSLILLVSTSIAADFACVDSQKIVTQSKYVAKAQKEFRNLMERYQKQLMEKQKKIEELRRQLEQGVLSENAKKKKEQEIQKLEMEIRKLQLEAQEQLNKKRKELEEKIYKRLQGVVKEIAKKKKLQVVFDCAAMIYHEPKVDITAEVLKKLDATK